MHAENVLNVEKYSTLVPVPDILEMERAKLHSIVLQYGVASPQALRQSRIVDNIILMYMKKRYKYAR